MKKLPQTWPLLVLTCGGIAVLIASTLADEPQPVLTIAPVELSRWRGRKIVRAVDKM